MNQSAARAASTVRESRSFYGPPFGSMSLGQLHSLDWDFRDAETRYLTHALHPYPAKFIPHIPHALIESLSKPGDVVADIFCGSGTTLVEALLLGRRGIGVDASELACLISKAKTARLTKDDSGGLAQLAACAEALQWRVGGEQSGLFSLKESDVNLDIPQDAAIEFWFEPHVARELGAIRSLFVALPETVKIVAQACFSSIIVAVSKQDSDTRYVRRDKGIRPGETLRRFAQALRAAGEALNDFTRVVNPTLSCEVIHADVLAAPEIGEVDLVVTSPPYPNAYSYHLYHMTRMLWLGMDQPTFKAREIGSHRKYSRNGPNAATAMTYKAELETIFGWLHKRIRLGGHCCFVIGDSIVKGKVIRNDQLVIDAATARGFSLLMLLNRRLQDTRKAFNPSIGKIKEERIVILRRH